MVKAISLAEVALAARAARALPTKNIEDATAPHYGDP